MWKSLVFWCWVHFPTLFSGSLLHTSTYCTQCRHSYFLSGSCVQKHLFLLCYFEKWKVIGRAHHHCKPSHFCLCQVCVKPLLPVMVTRRKTDTKSSRAYRAYWTYLGKWPEMQMMCSQTVFINYVKVPPSSYEVGSAVHFYFSFC